MTAGSSVALWLTVSAEAGKLAAMASSGPGPRDYTAAAERALCAFAGTTCYGPDCKTPVIVFVEGEPLYELKNVVAMVRIFRAQGGTVSSLVGEASLGSGETIESTELPVECLGPID